MTAQEIVRAWGRILQGKRPSLSIEITRECPLRCPGCYAYEPGHPGEGLLLRELADYKDDALVANILRVVDERRPLHLSLVGGDPLVRYRELDKLLPLLEQRGIHVQVVTSAFREIPRGWAKLKLLRITVSVDGLQREHDARRAPATYARILKNIRGHCVNLHCTITAQMMQRRGYLQEFLQFWTPRAEVNKVWFSMFTPQKGAEGAEILSRVERERAVEELLQLKNLYPKLDMAPHAIQAFLNPPASPDECIFATTTEVLSADLKTRVTPCQFGGNPDCSQCGCVASMGMAAVGDYKLGGVVPLQRIYETSRRMGDAVARLRTNPRKLKSRSRAA
jgi:MoaA/NifB/PqqE/SkfB family radical SAM enzyme